jgi:uncharacterized peroxidase-related enzyme
MSRIALIQPGHAPAPVQKIFDALQRSLGVVPNMTKVMANSPAVLQSYVGFAGALSGGSLTRAQGEQIALLTAEENSCTYCLSAHSVLGKAAGLDVGAIDAARQGRASDAKTAGVLAFAKAVIAGRGAVSDADFASARRAGLSDAELGETVAHVALNLFTNYVNRAFKTEVDFPVVRPAIPE